MMHGILNIELVCNLITRQAVYCNVPLRRVRVNIVALEKQ
jgi:hypothetical protein